jgi:cell division septation protein DedD
VVDVGGPIAVASLVGGSFILIALHVIMLSYLSRRRMTRRIVNITDPR